ncbi:MAG: T9SS type A sorting domain-containing protein [Brumimicrobium sp.]|nr:T9SS type A sorting domain-containing protein [Brumimicrobium sp.]
MARNQSNFTQKNTPIWGTGAAAGAAEGEFQNTFSTGTLNPTSWSAISINDANATPGNAFWARSTTGESQGAYWGTRPPITSPTQTNGVALFDSDFMDNGGTQGAFGLGSSPAPHKGELISPVIDLTGYTDSALTVNFYCYWRNYATTEFSVSISVDNGASWSAVDIISLLPAGANAENQGWVDAVFANETAGVTNLTQCRIKFTFDGEYYFAMIDDVSIATADAFDLTIATANPNGNTVGDSFKELHITNNSHFPMSQLRNNLKFGANVKNYGAIDYEEQSTATLDLTIQRSINGSYSTVYTQSMIVDTVLIGGNGNAFFDDITDTTWIQPGVYKVIYDVNLAEDANPNNDSLIHYFSINNDSYASKVSTDLSGAPRATTAIFPGGTAFSKFEYGSMFNFPSGGTQNMTLDSISFQYYIPSSYTGTDELFVGIRVYEWYDLTQDGQLDTDPSSGELNVVAVAEAQLSNLIGATQTFRDTTVPVMNVSTFNELNLVDGKTYLVTLLLEAGGLGFNPFPSFTSENMIWLGASEEKNYGMNYLYGDLAQRTHVSPVLVLDENSIGDWNPLGFGADVVPSIGLVLSSPCSAAFSTINPTACNEYLSPAGNLYTTSGTYLDTIPAAAGCDSVITINLTVDNVDVSVTNSSPTLSATVSGASYQWLDCDNNYAVIPGETSQNFTATANGNYAVEITQSNCTDTSACNSVSNVGINNNDLSKFNVYPNPTKDKLTIELIGSQESDYSILDVTGRMIKAGKIEGIETTIDVSNFKRQIYFIKIGEQVIKFVKQ